MIYCEADGIEYEGNREQGEGWKQRESSADHL